MHWKLIDRIRLQSVTESYLWLCPLSILLRYRSFGALVIEQKVQLMHSTSHKNIWTPPVIPVILRYCHENRRKSIFMIVLLAIVSSSIAHYIQLCQHAVRVLIIDEYRSHFEVVASVRNLQISVAARHTELRWQSVLIMRKWWKERQSWANESTIWCIKNRLQKILRNVDDCLCLRYDIHWGLFRSKFFHL